MKKMLFPELGATGKRIRVHRDCTKLLAQFKGAPLIIHDTETNGLDPYLPSVPMWDHATKSFSPTDGAEPFCHFIGFYDKEKDLLHVGYISSKDTRNMARLRDDFILNQGCTKVGHNYKFDIGVCRKLWTVAGPIFDTLTASRMLYDRLPSHTLKYLGNYFTGSSNKPDRYELTVKKFLTNLRATARKRNKLYLKYKALGKPVPIPVRARVKEALDHKYNYSCIPEDMLFEYGVKDIIYTFVLFMQFAPTIYEKHKPLFEFEMELIRLVHVMEQTGVRVDPTYITKSLADSKERTEAALINADVAAVLIAKQFDPLEPPSGWVRNSKLPNKRKADRAAWKQFYTDYTVIGKDDKKLGYLLALESYNKHVGAKPDGLGGSTVKFVTHSMNHFFAEMLFGIKMQSTKINIASPKQLLWLLRSCLHLDDSELQNKEHKVSTDKEVIARLTLQYPDSEFFTALTESRTYGRLANYFEGFKKSTGNFSSERLHCNLKVSDTATGRTACSNPNLQNIPNVKGVDISVRRAFIPAKGMQLLFYDYSQIEMRVFALFCQEKEMLKAFKEGRDLHNVCSRMMFGDELPEHRKAAKITGFGLIYGMGVQKLADSLGMSYNEARDFKAEYLGMFPRITALQNACTSKLYSEGYVEDIFGRHYHLPVDWSYKAVNSLVQGASANVLKTAMLQLDRYIKYYQTYRKNSEFGRCRILLPIHDELIIEAPVGLSDMNKAMIKVVMEEITTVKRYGVTTTVDASESPHSWEEKVPRVFDQISLDTARETVYTYNTKARYLTGRPIFCDLPVRKVDWFTRET